LNGLLTALGIIEELGAAMLGLRPGSGRKKR
jgi:hypothetical protein